MYKLKACRILNISFSLKYLPGVWKDVKKKKMRLLKIGLGLQVNPAESLQDSLEEKFLICQHKGLSKPCGHQAPSIAE